MPAGILPRDLNFIPVFGGTSNATDSASSIRPFQYDASTRGIIVHIVGDDVGNGGLTNPAIDSYTNAPISAVTGSNQSLISAPGSNKQVWVYGLVFTTTVAGTVAIQDEDDTAISGAMNFAQYSGINNPPSGNFSMPMFKVATNKALEVDVTTATINGTIWYAIVSV